MSFNPTIKEMMDENPKLTLMGLWWAQTWRFMVCYAALWIAILVLLALLGV